MLTHTLDLTYNLALLVALSVISGFLRQHRSYKAWGPVLQGLLFGGAAVIGMMHPLVLGPGLIFDGRSVMISLCGLFFGPLAVGIAGGMAALYRISLGGAGVHMGWLVITASALLGFAFHRKWTSAGMNLSVGRLLGFGLAVHVAMVLLMFTLPAGAGLGVIKRIGLPILLAYPLATLLIGKVLSAQAAGIRTVEALRESEARYRVMVRYSSDPIFAFNPDETYHYVNDAFARAFHKKPEEIIGKTPHALFSHEEAEKRLTLVRRVFKTGLPEEIEVKVVTPTGEVKWFLTMADLVKDKEQNTVIVSCLSKDISERKAAEAALEQSEARYRTQFDLASEGIFTLSPEGAVLDVNSAFARMHGYTKAELLSMNVQDLDTGASSKLVPERMCRLLAGEALTFEVEHLHRDGHVFPMEVSANLVVSGGVPTLLCFHRDISERKRAHEALRKSEARLQRAESVANIGNWELNLADRKMRASPGASAIYGVQGAEWDLAAVQGLVLPEYRAMLDDALANLIERDLPYSTEYRIQRPSDGQLRDIHSIAEHDRSRGTLFGVIQDITELKQAEAEKLILQAQLQQSQKMESLGVLAGGVAHDMNNVLGAILGLASATIEEQEAGSPTQRAFATIIKAAERGGKLVKGLLSFARQSPAESHELDLNALLQDEVHLLERTTLAKVRLVTDFGAKLRPIRGDAGALTHAFMNLCVNAVDAMPEHGTLTLRTRNVDNDWIEVMVEDTGTGMTQEVLEKAMDPFFTTKETGKGTGLGLSMVYSTVKAHLGWMEIHSEPGHGTRVRLRFPACEPGIPNVEPLAAAGVAPQGALTVLLVDDDELIQSSLLAILEALGHRATGVSCGEEALAKLAAGFAPDLVLLDMNMPGLGGAGTLPRLRALRPNTPVLLATGRVDQFALDLAAAHPHVTLLSKPFSMKELEQRLATLAQPAS